MRVSHPRAWLLLLLFNIVASQSSDEGTSTIGSREFPADVKLTEATTDSKYQAYGMDLVIQSGGIGIGLGLIFTIIMFFHLCCWGFCCKCCRCCFCKLESTRHSSCFKRKCRLAWFIVAIVITLLAVIGVLIIFMNTSTMYEKLDNTFLTLENSLKEGEDFLCQGTVPASLRSETTLSSLKSANGGTQNLMQQCSGNSVGEFMTELDTKVNRTFGSMVTLINEMSDVLTAMNNTITTIENVTANCVTINNTILSIHENTTHIKTYIDAIDATGLYSGNIPPSSQLPSVESIDLATPSVTQSALETAKSELVTERNKLMPTIQTDLGVTLKNTIDTQWGEITLDLVKVEDQILDQVKQLVDYENDLDAYHDQAASTEMVGQYIMAGIYSVSAVCLIIMLLGFICKKRCPMCCGAYFIFIFFIWLAFILGVFIMLSMILYDICGCEGTYTVAGCTTLMTIVKTNVGKSNITILNSEVAIDETLEQLLSCPDSSNSSGYMYTPTSNFVDILGVADEFNFTKYITDATSTLEESTSTLNSTAATNAATTEMNVAKNAMAKVAVGISYNYTNDTSRYQWLRTELLNPSQAPTYYPTFSLADNSANIVRLTALQALSVDVEDSRDVLVHQKLLFNISVDNVIVAIAGIGTAVENGRNNVNNASLELQGFVDHAMRINRYTPCKFVGNLYANVVIGEICETLYITVDSVVPGAIICLVAMLLGFFFLVMMRDCVIFYYEEKVEPMEAGDLGSSQPRAIEIDELPAGLKKETPESSASVPGVPEKKDSVPDPAPMGETREDGVKAPI